MLPAGTQKPLHVLGQELNALRLIRSYSSPLDFPLKVFTQRELFANSLVTGPEFLRAGCPSTSILALRWHIARKAKMMSVEAALHRASIQGLFPCQAVVSVGLIKHGCPMAPLYAAVTFILYTLYCAGAIPAASPLFRDSPASLFSTREIASTVITVP